MPVPESTAEAIVSRIRRAPGAPGVYWMRDVKGRILYVGKAVNLRQRLGSHFRSGTGSKTQKVHRNWGRVRDVQWMATGSDTEALVLEESLINEYQPPFNIVQPHYGFLCLSQEDRFPRLQITYRMEPGEGKVYFGPYPDRVSLGRLYQSLLPLFRVRGSQRHCEWDGETPRAPCHYLDFGWCSAPCAGQIAVGEYQADVNALARLLSGSEQELAQALILESERRLALSEQETLDLAARQKEALKEMRSAARDLRFEQAARLRDRGDQLDRQKKGARARADRLRRQIIGLRRAAEATRVVQPQLPDLDIWSLAGSSTRLALVVIPYRAGRAGAAFRAIGTLDEIFKTLRLRYRKNDAPRLILAPETSDCTAPQTPSEDLLNGLAKRMLEQWSGDSIPQLHHAKDNAAWSAACSLAVLNARLFLETSGKG